MKLSTVALTFSALFAFTRPAHAQFGILSQPLGARTAGMSLSGVADNSDPSGVALNPANVVGTRHVHLVGSKAGIFDDFFSDFDTWSVDAGGSWKFDETGEWIFGTNLVLARADREYFYSSAQNQLVTLALGAGMNKARYEFRFGGAIKRWDLETRSFDPFYDSTKHEVAGYAYDAGVAFTTRGDEARWNVSPGFAFSVTGLGSDLDYPDGFSRPLLTRYSFGSSIRIASPLEPVIGDTRVPVVAAVVDIDAVALEEGDGYWAVGTEVCAAQVIFFRFGTLINDEDGDLTYGFGLGLPISAFRIRFDYTDDAIVRGEHATLLLAWSL
jgi:hypothetical protein